MSTSHAPYWFRFPEADLLLYYNSIRMNRESPPIETAQRIALNFLGKDETKNAYCNLLAYEALLLFADEIQPVPPPRDFAYCYRDTIQTRGAKLPGHGVFQ